HRGAAGDGGGADGAGRAEAGNVRRSLAAAADRQLPAHRGAAPGGAGAGAGSIRAHAGRGAASAGDAVGRGAGASARRGGGAGRSNHGPGPVAGDAPQVGGPAGGGGMNAAFAFLLQATPDVRSVSWWLPHGSLRDAVWVTVLLLNLAVLLWILYKLLFAGEKWSIPQELRKRGEGIQ